MERFETVINGKRYTFDVHLHWLNPLSYCASTSNTYIGLYIYEIAETQEKAILQLVAQIENSEK